MREGEDNMDVTRGEKLRATCCDPPFKSACLTLRTVAISRAVILGVLENDLETLVLVRLEHVDRSFQFGERNNVGHERF
jgi:hypothetical protein